MRFLIILLCMTAIAVGCQRLTGGQEAAIQHGTGVVGTVLGLPPAVGEALGSAVVAAISLFIGHKHGRSCERKKAKTPA